MKTLRLAALFLALSLGAAEAADNAVILTPGVGVTMRSKDVGAGVQSMMPIPGDVAGNPLATAPGSGNTSYALPMQGVAGGVAMPISGTVTATLNSTPSLANGNGVVPTQGGSVLSATNGGYSNILQGNTALSATNGLFANILQGNAVLSTSNPIFVTGTGTAGSAATNPITVQGIASMTPVLVNPGTAANFGVGATGSAVPANAVYLGITSGGNLTGWNGAVTNAGTFAVQATLQASATTAIGKVDPNTIASWGLMSGTTPGTAPTNTLITGGIYNSSAPSPSNGNTLPFQLDSSGNLLVNVKAGGGSGGTSIADNASWTEGTTNFTIGGGEYTSGGATACTTAHACAFSMTSARYLQIDTPNIEIAQGGATAATDAAQVAGVYNSSAPTLTNGQGGALQLTSAGSLHTTVDNTIASLEWNSDGNATTLSGSQVSALLYGYNGSTVDRLRDNSNKSLVVSGYGTAGSPDTAGVFTVQGSTATGSALASYPVLVGGSDGTDVRNIATDSSGHVQIAPGAAGAAGWPIGATPYTASTTGTTAATTATLTGASSVTTYLCGFSIRANATAAATGNATVTGTITGTLNYTQWTAPLASGLGVTEQIFTPCLPASSTDTSIAVVSAAPGSGGTVSVTAWGFKL